MQGIGALASKGFQANTPDNSLQMCGDIRL
jgi:hypothetical protein